MEQASKQAKQSPSEDSSEEARERERRLLEKRSRLSSWLLLLATPLKLCPLRWLLRDPRRDSLTFLPLIMFNPTRSKTASLNNTHACFRSIYLHWCFCSCSMTQQNTTLCVSLRVLIVRWDGECQKREVKNTEDTHMASSFFLHNNIFIGENPTPKISSLSLFFVLRDTLAIYKLKWCPIRTWHGIELPLSLLVAFVDFSCFLTLTFQKNKITLYCSFLLVDWVALVIGLMQENLVMLHWHLMLQLHNTVLHVSSTVALPSHPWKYSPSFSGHFPFKVLCKNHCHVSASATYIAT